MKAKLKVIKNWEFEEFELTVDFEAMTAHWAESGSCCAFRIWR